MLKGFTLLEMLVVILIVSITALFALPAWQQTNTQLILAKEQHKLQLFLRQIQARVENSTEIWFLIANRDLGKKTWCNCLQPNSCRQDVSAHFYYPKFSDKTMLVSKRYYPTEVTRFSGIRDTATSACFVLQAEDNRTLFSFFNVGSLKLKDYQSASACVNSGE